MAGIAAFAGVAESDAKPVSPEVQLTVTGTHLHVPVENGRDKKDRVKLGIYDGQQLVQDFDVALPRDGKADWIAMTSCLLSWGKR